MRRLDPLFRHLLILPVLVAGLLLAPPLRAEVPSEEQRLQSLEQQLDAERKHKDALEKEAASLAGDANSVQEDLIKGARAMQEYETTLTRLESKLALLESQRSALMTTLRQRDKQTVRVLTALQRLAWRPSQALIAQPLTPTEAVRSAILLRAAVPQIQKSVKELTLQITQLNVLRSEISAQKDRISSVSREMNVQQIALERLFARKSDLQQTAQTQSAKAAKRVAALAGEAEDLRDLLHRLTTQRKQMAEDNKKELARQAAIRPEPKPHGAPRPQPEPEPKSVETAALVGFGRAKGNLPYPARGRVVERYGEKNDVGLNSKGVVIRSRPGAQVIAPYEGVVVFAGPFRRYGQLLIIEHSEGYHTLLAGMTRIDASVGQQLLGGEPVGVMASNDKPDLYVELRRNGQPINPLPWLVASKG